MTALLCRLAFVVTCVALVGCAQRLLGPCPPAEQEGVDSAEALYETGVRHARGEGVPKDEGEAARWFAQAASRGDPRAQYALYLLHETGRREVPEGADPLVWLRGAASAGLPDAMFDLGTHYAQGRGVPKDLREAAGWFRMAADRAEPRAQLALAVMQVTGQGVPQDRVEALKWLTLAERGLEGDQRVLAAKRKEALRGTMAPADVTEADRRVDSWRPRND